MLGAGAMGCVYAAEHLELGRSCAVKVIRRSSARPEAREAALARFRIEALAGARLDHPNVLRVLDFGREPEGGLCYLVTEHLGGRDLADVLAAAGRLPEARVARIGAQIAAALEHAHDRGVLHRDLKPANVRVLQGRRRARPEDDRDEVKLLDFGTAHVAGGWPPVKRARGTDAGSASSPEAVPAGGAVMGTPVYMSPEQLVGDALDRRSDIYSLGVLLFELLTGRVPFDAPSLPALVTAHARGKPPRPSSLAGPLDPELEGVILACLRRYPDERPANAGLVRQVLERALARVERAPRGPAARRTLPSLPVPSVPRRRRPVLALLTASLAVAAWVMIFARLWTSGSMAEPLTARLGAVVRRLPDPAAEPSPKPRRRVDPRATEASWTARPDGPDAAAADGGAPRRSDTAAPTRPRHTACTSPHDGQVVPLRPSVETSAMSFVLWILFGLIVGVIAKLLTPGREPGGFVLTALLGIAGALLGGFLGRLLGIYPSYQSTGGFFSSILGAVIILGIYHAVTSHRTVV